MCAGFVAGSVRRELEEVEAFLRDSRPWAFRLALAILGRSELAEDASQEALIRAYSAKDTLRSVDSPKAWLRRVVVHESSRLLRSRRDLPKTAEDHPGHEESVLVRQVLDGLPAEHRLVLALAYFEELSYSEMAAALDIPEGTVASRLHHAKAGFRRAWEGS